MNVSIGMPKAGDQTWDYQPLQGDDWKGEDRIKVGFTAHLHREGVEQVCKHPDCITQLRHGNTTGLCADHYRTHRRRLERKL